MLQSTFSISWGSEEHFLCGCFMFDLSLISVSVWLQQPPLSSIFPPFTFLLCLLPFPFTHSPLALALWVNNVRFFRGQIITHCPSVSDTKHTRPAAVINTLYMATPSLQPSVKHQPRFHQSVQELSAALGERQLQALTSRWLLFDLQSCPCYHGVVHFTGMMVACLVWCQKMGEWDRLYCKWVLNILLKTTHIIESWIIRKKSFKYWSCTAGQRWLALYNNSLMDCVMALNVMIGYLCR